MNEVPSLNPTIYAGWHDYQSKLITALAPLTDVQLGLRVEPGIRSIEEIVTHMIGARARWFQVNEDAVELQRLPAGTAPACPCAAPRSWWRGWRPPGASCRRQLQRWTPEEWAQEYSRRRAGRSTGHHTPVDPLAPDRA